MIKKREGFTLVETSIAIAFLSILLIAILTLTITAGKLYVKGDTNKTINQSGRDFSDIIRRDFLSTSVSTITPQITVDGGNPTTYSGRVCLGTVSYLWNSANLLNATTALAGTARVTIGSAKTPVKFARVVNPKQSYCDKGPTGKYPMNIPSTERANDLFGGTGRDYALYAMSINPVAVSGNKGLYQIVYTLGTNEKNTTQNDASNSYIQCKPNNSLTADFNYCAVEDFDMIVRVGGTE